MFSGLQEQSNTGGGPFTRGAPGFDAGVALARLDERVASAPEAVRAGWISRALIQEAVASERLNGVYVTTKDLTLMLADSAVRTPDQDLGRAVHTHQMLGALSRRNANHLFSPVRLIALTRLRLREGLRDPDERMPYWLRERLRDRTPELVRGALEDGLHPDTIAACRSMPVLEGAGALLMRWHLSGAAECIGGEYGRALASGWVRRAGLTSGYYFLPSVGFLGHAADYRPDLDGRWDAAFLAACGRAAEWGLRLLGRLAATHRRMHEAACPRSRKSKMGQLVELIVAQPAISAERAAKSLGVTPHAARRLLGQLEAKGAIQECTGRGSFRLYGLPE